MHSTQGCEKEWGWKSAVSFEISGDCDKKAPTKILKQISFATPHFLTHAQKHCPLDRLALKAHAPLLHCDCLGFSNCELSSQSHARGFLRNRPLNHHFPFPFLSPSPSPSPCLFLSLSLSTAPRMSSATSFSLLDTGSGASGLGELGTGRRQLGRFAINAWDCDTAAAQQKQKEEEEEGATASELAFAHNVGSLPFGSAALGRSTLGHQVHRGQGERASSRKRRVTIAQSHEQSNSWHIVWAWLLVLGCTLARPHSTIRAPTGRQGLAPTWPICADFSPASNCDIAGASLQADK